MHLVNPNEEQGLADCQPELYSPVHDNESDGLMDQINAASYKPYHAKGMGHWTQKAGPPVQEDRPYPNLG